MPAAGPHGAASAGGGSSPAGAAPGTGDGHGAVSGAAEVAEPQLGLTTIDRSGTVTHLDLLDESLTTIGRIDEPHALTTDGRYLFAATRDGVEIVDSGVWTWDHIDHFHYYRAEPRLLGTVSGSGSGSATVATTNLSTSGGTGLFFPESGDAVLLDTAALSRGEVEERFRMRTPPHAGLVVPVGSYALVTEPSPASLPAAATSSASAARAVPASSVTAYTADGEPTGVTEACTDAAGTITTRVGAVIGCTDGALLATVTDDELVLERIPYPAGSTAPAATSFDNREGRPTVAGLAGSDGIWMLDTRRRSWSLLPVPTPLAAVTAVDDDEQHVLALATDGRMLVIDGADGSLLAQTDPLVADSLAAGETPRLVADQQRAYLSGPRELMLWEIDFADDARIARSFPTSTEPAFAAETGR
ncbi:ABC transporter [Herbiconiux sp. A18JL235]|uniref:ABC transporter n=1 Tax=Herbiconiux sp. A18JL235 TaxID=3152363 RepID=A0AB39BFH0_9MICO